MGVSAHISFDQWPKQGTFLNLRAEVCFRYDTERVVMGTIVRNDSEGDGITIIKLDDGRFVLGTECQYRPIYGSAHEPSARQCNHGAISPKGTMLYHGYVQPKANLWRCDVCKGIYEGNLTEPNTLGSQALTLVGPSEPPSDFRDMRLTAIPWNELQFPPEICNWTIRQLFNKAIGAQNGNRFSFAFEEKYEADAAFEFIAALGDISRHSETKSASECGACDKPGEHCAIPPSTQSKSDAQIAAELQTNMDAMIEPTDERERQCYRRLIRIMARARNRLQQIADAQSTAEPPTADLLGALRDARRYVEAYEPRDVSEAHDRDLMLNSIDALAPSTKSACTCPPGMCCEKSGAAPSEIRQCRDAVETKGGQS